VLGIGSGVLGVLLLSSCDRGNSAPADGARPSPVRQVQVVESAMRPMERVVGVVGTLAARYEATVAAQVAGQLEQTLVDLGDRVGAGQEIARIDTTSYQALAEASAANLARARASAANAEQNLKRIQELQREMIASASDLDAAVADAARTRAEVKAAEANDAVARLNLERSRVKSPFAGAIAQRLATVGDYLSVGSPIVRLVQTDPLRLRLDVPERNSPYIQVGQTVRLTVEGDTNLYQGRLARVSPAIRNDNRMLPVEADVPNPGGLRAGLFARAQIVIEERDEVLSVPEGAITAFAGLEKVVLIEDGKAVERNVITGRRQGGWVEIVSGLEAGANPVLDPTGIRTGQSLEVSPPLSASVPASDPVP